MGCCSSSEALAPGDDEPGPAIAAPVLTAPPEANTAAAPSAARTDPSPPPLNRAHTSRSLAMEEALDGLQADLTSMQETSEAAARELMGTPKALPIGLRSQLATLHGTANKLLATRLDAIVTSDLTTGRDEARAKRKALVAATEVLIERIEGQIKWIDRCKAGELPIAAGSDPMSTANAL